MRSDASGTAIRIGIAASALVAMVGIATWPLSSAAFVRAVADDPASLAATGLARARALETVETVRLFVLGGVDELPATVDGRAGFDGRAVSHLADVRDVMRASRFATWIAGALLLVFVAAARVSGRTGAEAGGYRLAGLALTGAVGAATVAGSLAPRWVFARFHDLFFAPGTWLFPEGDLLVALFPGRYWALTGAAWAAVCLAGSVALLVSAHFRSR